MRHCQSQPEPAIIYSIPWEIIMAAIFGTPYNDNGGGMAVTTGGSCADASDYPYGRRLEKRGA